MEVLRDTSTPGEIATVYTHRHLFCCRATQFTTCGDPAIARTIKPVTAARDRPADNVFAGRLEDAWRPRTRTGGNIQVLDQLSDTDSGLQLKSTARAGGVAGSIRHLTHEDLQAYASGQLPPG